MNSNVWVCLLTRGTVCTSKVCVLSFHFLSAVGNHISSKEIYDKYEKTPFMYMSLFAWREEKKLPLR